VSYGKKHQGTKHGVSMGGLDAELADKDAAVLVADVFNLNRRPGELYLAV
jgi:hypothetical protein